MRPLRVREVRALLPARHPLARDVRVPGEHWITHSRIASPMSSWPAYRETRASWGIDALGPFVVEVELTDDTVGVGVSTGDAPACFLLERHLARFAEGRELSRASIRECWEQMYAASLPYGRKGLALHAISALDLALWDAWARSRGEPVYALLGGAVRTKIPAYATTPDAGAAQALGFAGAKLPLPAGAADGASGLAENVAGAKRARAMCGADPTFFLAYDCYMSLDVPSAVQLAASLDGLGLAWLEECLPPDDYWGYRELHAAIGGRIALAAGEHEATAAGFRLLLEYCPLDIVQPDLSWCGGLSELLEVVGLARAAGAQVVPHGSSVYGYHLAAADEGIPFVEFPLLDPSGTEVVPPYAPLLVGEPVPVGGVVSVGDAPGFGVHRNQGITWDRPWVG